MIYMWFTGINYYKLAVEKDRDFIFTTITTIWKPGLLTNRPKGIKTFISSRYLGCRVRQAMSDIEKQTTDIPASYQPLKTTRYVVEQSHGVSEKIN
jgi:hypothetical protein